ncbi:hypothetical protein ACQ4PT_040856 [Festuca glaucescens]
MDAGVGRMNSCYHTMESIDNTLSFTDLLSMVAHEAENNKGRNGINLNNVESGCINNEIMYPDVLTASQEKNKEILLCSELPDESIDTCLFGDSSLVCGSVNGFGDMVKTTGTRSYSTFNNVEEDCGGMDVTSQNKEYNGGPIEESMRKYCEDKKSVMFKPELGMQFSSTEEAYQFYNMYSWVAGFSIRLGDNYTNKQKQRTMQEYLCQRQGYDNETKNSTTRCGCKALMRVSMNDNSIWYVKKFVGEHNHDMVESCGEKKHLPSHRQIDKHTKEMIRHLRENNVSLTRVNLVMGSLFGSMEKVPFSKKTLRTVCSRIAKEALIDDVQKTLESFREKISRDPRFVFTAELDDDNRLNSLMWTSGRSRSLYQHFGDVVTFDTTYETNIYKMPFGMFVGVNNHFQSVIFAGVLLTNETSANFKWAFEEFVSMMGGKAPQTMLTDQSLAMTIAIRENLLNTSHRWCKWHVLRKAQEALGHVHKLHSTFSDDFNKVVNHMLTPEEFESGWEYLTRTYDLSENPFMTRAFEVRDKWAKPYFNDIFCARMSSTQRSESANHVLKVYVPCKSSINMFVKQYTKLIDDRERADDEAEKNKNQKVSKPLFGFPIEKHASKIYTPTVFKLFKAELRKTSSYIIVSSSEGTSYEVMHVDAENRDAWSRVNFTITVEPELGLHKCQCRLYEHFGIVCCHIMLVMIQSGVMKIPDCHIMKRWTVNAREGTLGLISNAAAGMQHDDLRTLRHKKLYMHVLDLVSAGEYDETTAQLAVKYVELAKKKIDDYRSTISRTCQVGYNLANTSKAVRTNHLEGIGESGDNSSCGLQLFDRSKNYGIEVSSIKAPILKEKMGRPSNKRFLTRFDTNIRKNKGKVNGVKKIAGNGGRTGVHRSRFCSSCKSPDHDIRTCPNQKENNQKPRKRGKTSFACEFKF